MGKKISIRWLLVLGLVAVIIMLLFGAAVRHQLLGGRKLGKVGEWAVTVAAYPKMVRDAFNEVFGTNQQIIINRNKSIDGLTYFTEKKDSGALLTTVYDPVKHQTIVKLIDLLNGNVLHQWVPPLKDIRNNTHNQNPFFYVSVLNSSRARALHPLLLPDGSIIVKMNEGPLLKLDSNSKLVWLIDGVFHHSTEIDANGNFWSPTVLDTSFVSEDLVGRNRNDAIACISPQGKIISKESIAQILSDNGYRGLLLGTGIIEEDPLHLNEVMPALYSTKYWQKGDLLVSLRHKSTIFLYRPSTHKILWLKTGPWLNQHCPDFIDSSHISIFGNNIVRNFSLGGEKLFKYANQVYIYNFANDSITKPFSKVLQLKKIATITEGRVKILRDGDAFIEESNFGRAFRVSTNHVIWEYKSPVDAEHISILSWSRYLLKTEKGKFDFKEN